MAAINGSDKSDKLTSLAQGDEATAHRGPDRIHGGSGNGLLIGGNETDMMFKADLFSIAESRTVTVPFDSEEAGYRRCS